MSEWISVDDSMPEFEKDVLFYCFGGRPPVVAAIFKNDDGSIEINAFDDPYKNLFGIVTHWQPLPEPPESDHA